MNIAHAAYSRARLEVAKNRIKIQVCEVDRQRLYNCKTIYGSRNMHFVHFVSHFNNVLLQV